MDRSGQVIADGVNVTIGATEAIFDTIEAISEAIIDCIEAVAQAVSKSTKLTIYVLIIESLKEVGASDCSLDCGIVVAISEQAATAKNCEPYEVDKLLCCEMTDSVIPLYVTTKNRLYLLLKEKSCTSD